MPLNRPASPEVCNAVVKALICERDFRQLKRDTGVSDWTLRLAIESLERDGVVSKRKGIDRGHRFIYGLTGRPPVDRSVRHYRYQALDRALSGRTLLEAR